MLVVMAKDGKDGESYIFGTAIEGGWVDLPGGARLSPAKGGLSGDCYSIIDIGEPNEPEAGYESLGDRRIEIVDGVPSWVETFVKSNVDFPTLTHRQFWLTAWDVGVTKESLKAKILSTYPEDERGRAALEVELATSFERSHPLMNELCILAGISPEELDSLWFWASSI